MPADALLHAANASALLGCLLLKLPQIFILLRSRSAAGVSLSSLLLELCGFIVFVKYQMYYEYPPPTYLEYPILIAQDIVLLVLILHFSGRLRHSASYIVLFAGGWWLLTAHRRIIDLAMCLCTFISAASKFAQLQCLWTSKDAGQLSALSWAMACYTCLARIYTTSVTTGDLQVLVRFVVMTLLNMWVLLSIMFYQRRSCRKDD